MPSSLKCAPVTLLLKKTGIGQEDMSSYQSLAKAFDVTDQMF